MNIRLIDAGQVSYLRSQTIYHALAYAKKKATPDTVVLSVPQSPYVCIGFHRNLEHEVDTDFCAANNIPVIRRETGGGTVYIDNDQLFVQWIFAPDSLPKKTDTRFGLFVRPLIQTYQSFGINACFHAPTDVHVSGKKIVGTGAAAIGNAEVVTGNFLFDFDCRAMANILKVPDESFRQYTLDSLNKYMTSIKRELENPPTMQEVKNEYIKKCAETLGRQLVPGHFTDEEYCWMEKLDKKFSSKEWTRQYASNKHKNKALKIHADVWMYQLSQKTPGGTIEITLRTKGNRIDHVAIKGDFKIRPPQKLKGLENVLHNVELNAEALTEILEAFYILHRIETPGVNVKDWVEAIMQIENYVKH